MPAANNCRVQARSEVAVSALFVPCSVSRIVDASRWTAMICLFALATGLAGCLGGNEARPSSEDSDEAVSFRMSDAEFDAMSPVERYAVVNKITGTLYKGVPVDQFFDLSAGLSPPEVKPGALDPSAIEDRLDERLDNPEALVDRINGTYRAGDPRVPRRTAQAILFELPLSRDYFERWMAYVLTNTILFSPALELETTRRKDGTRVYERLLSALRAETPISQIVYDHMRSQENWRRFRSPEDNTREMMEIFLGHFEDSDVPRAATACRNWRLSSASEGFRLVMGPGRNTEPQRLLGTTVTTCPDFYDAIAGHPDLIPHVTDVLARRFLGAGDEERRERLISAIVSQAPARFTELFRQILFSKAYLLETDRGRWFEETYFSIAHRIDWKPHDTFFGGLNNATSDFARLPHMGQRAMHGKVGRDQVPLDTVQFAHYHKSVREALLINANTPNARSGWSPSIADVPLEGEDYMHYLFLSVIARKAGPEEIGVLSPLIDGRAKGTQAMLVFDYLSRLPETYLFESTEAGAP